VILFEVLPKIFDKELRDDRRTQYRPARMDDRAAVSGQS
jgi:hypothetical protein